MMNRGYHLGAALGLALILGACGRTEPADQSANETPELTPVDSAAELESAPDQPIGTYANRKHGFSIAVPDGWIELHAAANEDGAIFESKSLDADLRVYGTADEADAEFEQAIEALRDGTSDVTGAMTGDNEYRGAATDAEGYRVELRMIRKPDGAMASALMRYPVKRAEEIAPLATKTLDSLRLR